MIIYFLIYTILLFASIYSFLYEKNKGFSVNLLSVDEDKKLSSLYYMCLCLVMLVTSCRDMIGGYDIYIYASYFEEVPSLPSLFLDVDNVPLSVLVHFEKGYLLFNSIIKTVFNNKYFFFIASAVLSYILFGKIFIHYNNYILILFLFFSKFFIVGFAYNRQFIAMSILWMSFHLLQTKKITAYILLFIAITFHIGALITIPFYLLYDKKIKKIWILGFYLFCALIGMTSLLYDIQMFAGDVFSITKITETYTETGEASVHYLYLFECLLLGGMSIVYKNKLVDKNESKMLYNMLVLYIGFVLLTLKSPGMLRLSWFFSLSYFIMLPRLLFLCFKQRYIVLLILLIYFSVIYFRGVFVRDNGRYIPYKVFFMENPKRNDYYGDI